MKYLTTQISRIDDPEKWFDAIHGHASYRNGEDAGRLMVARVRKGEQGYLLEDIDSLLRGAAAATANESADGHKGAGNQVLFLLAEIFVKATEAGIVDAVLKEDAERANALALSEANERREQLLQILEGGADGS